MSDRYAVIGDPVGHTRSPMIHGWFAETTDHDLTCAAVGGRPGGFADAADAFREAGGRGMSVTTPFERDAFDYATELSDRARGAGAVNTLKFDGARVLGENFDGVGLTRDVVHNLDCALHGRRVLLLGAGAVARSALPAFLAQGPAELVVANRTRDKAVALARHAAAHGPVRACGYGDLAGQRFDLVFNATSASLRGELPPVPASVFVAGGLAYDLVHGKGLTPFLRLAQHAGVRQLADGVGMLVEQAAEAFAWWRGVRPRTELIIQRLVVPLM